MAATILRLVDGDVDFQQRSLGGDVYCEVNNPNGKSSEDRAIKLFLFGLVLVVLAVIILPYFYRPRPTSAANACINNLRQIDAAANQFALEHGKTSGEAIHFPNDLTPYIKLNSAGKIPPCPKGGLYYISKVGEIPICSFGNTVTPAHVLP